MYNYLPIISSIVIHPEKKEVYVRALRRINNDSLEADLACLNIDIECDDVNVVVVQCDTSLSRLSDWMKIIRRKNEVI